MGPHKFQIAQLVELTAISRAAYIKSQSNCRRAAAIVNEPHERVARESELKDTLPPEKPGLGPRAVAPRDCPGRC